ncbi:hypothetical protein BDW74DRAFT_172602 [Aspergillus multicolor]|uniref:uncharacterized protein n=1 Tax=Aspergillus multicolor TaxID=41759 RepID=UPI003CCCFD12
MSDFPANTAYMHEYDALHLHPMHLQQNNAWMLQNRKAADNAGATDNSRNHGQYDVESQPGPGASAFNQDEVEKELDFDFDDVNTGEADELESTSNKNMLLSTYKYHTY